MADQSRDKPSIAGGRCSSNRRLLVFLVVLSTLLVGTHALTNLTLDRLNRALRRGDWTAADKLQAYWKYASPGAIRGALTHATWEHNARRARNILSRGPHISLDAFMRQQAGMYEPDLFPGSPNGPVATTPRFEDPDLLTALLDNGANPNALLPVGEVDPTRTVLGILYSERSELKSARLRRTSFELERILRQHGARLSIFDAARFGDVAELRRQLDAGASPMTNDWIGRPLIYVAALGGNVETARMLVDRRADVNAAAGTGPGLSRDAPVNETPLMAAERLGNARAAEFLVLHGALTYEATGSGIESNCAPLVPAAAYGNLQHLEFLLAHGARINAQMPSRRSAVMSACLASPTTDRFMLPASPQNVADREASQSPALSLLCRSGANVNARDAHGRTALLEGCWSVKLTRLLIQYGSDVNLCDTDGCSPLMTAVRLRQHDVAKLLLVSGARVNAEDNNNNTALGMAAHGELLMRVGKEFEDDLRRFGAHLSIQESAAYGDMAEMKWALVHGGSIHATSRRGGVPLLLTAVHGGNKSIVGALLGKGADVNATNTRGWTALMVAAEDGRRDLVTLLVEHGAHKDARNATGATAVEIAERNHRNELLPLLAPSGGQVVAR